MTRGFGKEPRSGSLRGISEICFLFSFFVQRSVSLSLLTFRLLGELVRWRNPQEKLKYDDYCSSEFVGTKNVVVEKEDSEGQLLVLLELSGRFLDGKHALLDKLKNSLDPENFLVVTACDLMKFLFLRTGPRGAAGSIPLVRKGNLIFIVIIIPTII